MGFNKVFYRVQCAAVLSAACAGTLSAQHLVSQALPLLVGMPAATAGMGSHTASGQGYLGVDIRTVTDATVSNLHLRETHGVVIIAVDHDSPAWKAGLRARDVVQSVNGAAMESEEQLRRTLSEMQPGRSIQLGISRDGSAQVLAATMARRDEIGKLAWQQHYVPPAPDDAIVSNDYNAPVESSGKPSRSGGHSFMPGHLLPYFPSYTGITVDEIGPQLADYFGLKGGKGLLVKSVEANSPAAAAGMHAGDVVLRVNGSLMTSRSDWNRALHDSKGHTVSVVVMREHREQTLTVVPDSKRRGALQEPEAPQAGSTAPHWLAVLLPR